MINDVENQHHFRDFHLCSAVPWDIWKKYVGNIPNCIKILIHPTNKWFGGCCCIYNPSTATSENKSIKDNSCERQKEGGKYPH